MRVTNEQIDAIRICHSQLQCSDCKYDKTLDDCDPSKLQLASDLLDARELIEKQEAIIKEMREVLDATRKTYSNEILTLAKMRIDEVLEKTKDYI